MVSVDSGYFGGDIIPKIQIRICDIFRDDSIFYSARR